MQVEQGTRGERAEHVAERAAERDDAHHAGPDGLRKPDRGHVDDAGIGTGFGDAKQQRITVKVQSDDTKAIATVTAAQLANPREPEARAEAMDRKRAREFRRSSSR